MVTFAHGGYRRYGGESYSVISVFLLLGMLSSVRILFKVREMTGKSEAIDMIESDDVN